jgi:hypothetical protein
MKVSKLLAAAAVSLLLTSAMAEEAKTGTDPVQKDNPPKTLIDIKNVNFSGYGGVYTRYSKIGEADGCLVGGRGGLIINDNFVLGLGGMGLTHPTDREKLSGSDYTGLLNSVGFGYGGFLAEYYFNPKDLIVFSAGTLIGGGGLSFYDDREQDDEGDHSEGDNFFVVEPEVNIFVNVTRFCRIGAGVSYRYVAGIDSDEFADKDFRGPSASIMAQFGWF